MNNGSSISIPALLRGAILLTGIFLLSTLATGCKTTVQPAGHTVYPSPYRIDDSVLISFPDDIMEREYRVKVGSLWEKQIFIVPLLDHYASETTGRMRGLFTQNIWVTTNSKVDEALERRMMDHQAGEEEEVKEERDLSKVLDEMAAVERGEDVLGEDEKKRTKEELTQEALRESSEEAFQEAEIGYLIRFQDAQLGFIDNRCVISFRVQFIDWRTQNVFFEKRYNRGQSRRFDPYRNNKTNENTIQALVTEAFAGKMRTLVEDISAVTGAQGYDNP